MKEQDVMNDCSRLLYKLCDEVERANSLNFYDINISSEYLFLELLNTIFGWNLENTNNEKKNTAAIDLYDDESKICVQITSDDTAKKIHLTLQKYRDLKLYKRYERIVFIVINKNKRYTADFDSDTNGLFTFSKNDIYDIDALLNEIRKLDLKTKTIVRDFLIFELDTILDKRCLISSKDYLNELSSNSSGFLNENYFEIDDERFIASFVDKFEKKDVLYINAFSREEGTYCLLNLLHKQFSDVPVFLVKDYNSWNMANKYLNGVIVIPLFYSGDIPASKGNRTIFIDFNNIYQNEAIFLRRRTKTFLKTKLKENGYEQAYELIEKTNGIFYYVKKQLYSGKEREPEWCDCHRRSFLTATLLGGWTNSDNDRVIIEKLSGIEYSEYMDELSNYTNGECPFVIKRYNDTYELADSFLAWYTNVNHFTDDLIKRFFEIVLEIIGNRDPIYDEPFDKQCIVLPRHEPKYSTLMKQKICHSVILASFEIKYRSKVNACISNILDRICNANDWAYISQFFESLCEASPETILRRLDNELKTDTGLTEIFTLRYENPFFGRNYYVHIIWAVEQLLSVKEHVVKAVYWLLKISRDIDNCAAGNTPKGVLSKVFCACYNSTALTIDEKKRLAKKAIGQYSYFWDIIFELVNDLHQIMPTYKFKYRESDDIIQYNNDEIRDQVLFYMELLVDEVGNNIDKWVSILKLLPCFPEDLFKKATQKLNDYINSQNDENKELIKSGLREIVFRHRRFANSNWVASENRVHDIEMLCKSISFSDKTYEYLFLNKNGEIQIYDPPEYSKEKNTDNLLHNRTDIALNEMMKDFRDCSLSWKQFMILLKEPVSYKLARIIAEYYSDHIFERQVFDDIASIPNAEKAAVDYALWCNKGNRDLIYQLLKDKKYKNNAELMVQLLRSVPINDRLIHLIEKLSENQKRAYWKNPLLPSDNNDRELIKYIISELIKYDSIEVLLGYLSEEVCDNDIIDIDTLISIMHDTNKSIIKKNRLITHMEGYDIEKIFEAIHQKINEDHYFFLAVSQLEIPYSKILNWENMKCTQYLFKTDPTYYTSVIRVIYGNQNSNDYKIDERIKELCFWFYMEAKFCPGDINGQMDENVFNKWIADFSSILSQQVQQYLIPKMLGRLFAFSPPADDGYVPAITVREYIEENADDNLINSFAIAVENERGVYWATEGKEEMQLSKKYKNIANEIRIDYPETARIYDSISENYYVESESERRSAEGSIV